MTHLRNTVVFNAYLYVQLELVLLSLINCLVGSCLLKAKMQTAHTCVVRCRLTSDFAILTHLKFLLLQPGLTSSPGIVSGS